MAKNRKSSAAVKEILPETPKAANPVASTSRKSWKLFLLGAVMILAATLLAYQPVRHASFIWDDNIMLTENPLVQSVEGLRDIWFSTKPHDYFPVTLTSLWLEWRLWGMNPA